MQRALVILTVIVLVTVSLGVGALSAHWPFWRRAWQWQTADDGWPAAIRGPQLPLQGGRGARPLTFTAAADLAAAATPATQVLARASGGRVEAFFAPGFDAATRVDGRALTAVLLPPLVAMLAAEHPGLLDIPLASHLPAWRDDQRGTITARQLLWQLSGLPAGQFRPLDPFNARAQLAAGPDFDRAALRWRLIWPPGSHFEESPVNAQLLSQLLAAVGGDSYAALVEQRLWSRVAADPAIAMLDHPRGQIAAHCCLSASVSDWLRLGLLLAADGATTSQRLWQPGFLSQAAQASPVHAGHGLGFRLRPRPRGGVALVAQSAGRSLLIAPDSGEVLLWIGTGPPPQQLERLLAADNERPDPSE